MEHKVIIYSTPSCAACNATKSYLKSKGVEYEEHNVGEDAEAREAMMQKNGGLMSVPTVDIDGNVFVGYDEEKLNELLELQ